MQVFTQLQETHESIGKTFEVNCKQSEVLRHTGLPITLLSDTQLQQNYNMKLSNSDKTNH